MTVTSILLLFHLLISLIARINHLSCCSRCLEASQMICDANRLTGFSLMRISIEGSFWAICETNVLVNRVILLLPVLRLALIFLICTVYLVFFQVIFSPSCQNIWQICLFWPRFDIYWRCSLVCTTVFDHSFVDLKNTYFQRCLLIWCNFVG